MTSEDDVQATIVILLTTCFVMFRRSFTIVDHLLGSVHHVSYLNVGQSHQALVSTKIGGKF
jgi:hypothetical protein